MVSADRPVRLRLDDSDVLKQVTPEQEMMTDLMQDAKQVQCAVACQ